jgi:hypothetical protein
MPIFIAHVLSNTSTVIVNCTATLQKGSLGLVGVVAAMRTHLFPLQREPNTLELFILSLSKT